MLLAIYLAVGALAIECLAGGDAAANCTPDKCESVGDSQICTNCGTGFVPINGKCTENAGAKAKCTTANGNGADAADRTCGKCLGTTFMYKGGCYEYTNTPGSAMCKTAAEGKCTEAVTTKEYFVPPDADNTHQSVISCADETSVVLASNKQYKGVANCLKCTAPADGTGAETNAKAATCTECASGYFVDTGNGNICSACAENCLTCADGTPDKCKSCTAETHFLASATAEGPCVSCGDATGSDGWKGVTGCAKCTKPASAGPATCTECQADKYLKTVGSTTSCETNCGEGFFATTVENIKKCVACSDNTNGGIADCSACTPIASPTTTVLVKCSACESNKKASPGGSSCVATCPNNSTASEGACICNSGFAPSGDSCVASSSVNLSIGTIVEYL